MRRISLTVFIIAILFFFALNQVYAQDIKLEWDPVTQPGFDHYVVFWGASPGVYSQQSDKIYKTNYEVTDLEDRIYFFSVKAYDDKGRASEFSNQVSTEDITSVKSSSSDSNSDCFIATAAYGSRMSPNVNILCRFRDEYLKTNTLGMRFIILYKRYSPFLANYISKHDSLKVAVRRALWPIIGLTYLFIHTDSIHKSIIWILLVVGSSWLFIIWIKKRTT